LVGAGLGVCIAPACVARLAPPEVVCLPLPDEHLTSDVGLMCRVGEQRPLVEGFARVALGTALAYGDAPWEHVEYGERKGGLKSD